ncbi:MAG: amino acid adenylation domain-containing protein, partial [Verrucomicrobiota bacterium]|nr:amino acid adenylation domain-containing protein [Verrucomicrobiota bacterium]
MSLLRSETAEAWQRSTGLQRAMILAALNPETPGAYLQQLVVRMNESLDAPAFARALEICFARHAGLMARFAFRDGELFQTRGESAPPAPEMIDLRDQSGSIEERLQKFLESDRARVLPLLSEDPLWRSSLLTLDHGEFAWVWTHHHALCDGASYGPLLLDLFATYDRLRRGELEAAPGVAPDFFDYLAWREAQNWEAPRPAWRARFSAGDAPSSLPEVRGLTARAIASDASGSMKLQVEINDETNAAVHALCEATELTPNTLVVAAIALWLARMDGADEAIFAQMRAARRSTLAGAASIVGPLVNTVPLRLRVPDDASVSDWLQVVRGELIALRALEHCSLGQISAWTGLEIGPSGFPLVLNFQRAPLAEELRAAGLAPERGNVSLIQRIDVPLLVNAFAAPRLAIEIIARPVHISAASARAVANGLALALRAIAQNPRGRIGDIDLITAQEHALLDLAGRGARVAVPERNAHEFIERQIAAQPNAMAMTHRGREFRFADLGASAARVADAIGKEKNAVEIVAVILPPGPEIVCAILGILRAGAAFFLINPATPSAERATMLERLAIDLAITDEAHFSETKNTIRRVLAFDKIARATTSATSPPRPREIFANNLAYLVHTSGSTGEKKFVEIEHGALANTLCGLIREYQMQPGDRRIARAMPGNDYFITEVLVCLSAGATLVFPEHCGALSIAEFMETLRRERITVTGLPASYWHEWVRALRDDGVDEIPPELRLVICSMEKADPILLAKWARLTSGRVHWLNAYGPAEVTIVSNAFHPDAARALHADHVPIGRPIANTEVYVLDRKLRRVPPGMTGEIAIAGVGVGRGYRGDAETTRAKFVANPHATSAEFSRLYLSGDYGYVDAEAQLVFLGRRDQQVKISGHRIELAEVEIALQAHPQIRQAIATAEGEEGERRLVAHLLADDSLDQGAFRTWLHGHLPPQLRPADFVRVDAVPILPTGKVDRRGLSAAYDGKRRAIRTELPLEAANTLGRMLALWSELFGHRHMIAPDDSFFHLGGNSLLAVRLLARIEKDFGEAFSLHDLFTHPSVAGLVALLERKEAPPAFSSLIALNSGGSGPPLFIFHGWTGGVFHTLEFARRLEGARPVFGLQAIEHAGLARHRTFAEMTRHYADEMIRAHPTGSYELFGHSLGGMIAYATALELVRRGRSVAR